MHCMMVPLPLPLLHHPGYPNLSAGRSWPGVWSNEPARLQYTDLALRFTQKLLNMPQSSVPSRQYNIREQLLRVHLTSLLPVPKQRDRSNNMYVM
jgi:hypothetical protein